MPKVDQELCIGCGTCETLCPQIFELSDASKAKVKQSASSDVDCIQEAINSCPAQAIS